MGLVDLEKALGLLKVERQDCHIRVEDQAHISKIRRPSSGGDGSRNANRRKRFNHGDPSGMGSI